MRDWVTYKNGNYTVFLNLRNGTKIRKNDLETLEPTMPESADVNLTDFCDAGCCYCFLPNEMVSTVGTKKPIYGIRVGDKVKSFNHSLGVTEIDTVEETHKRKYSGEIICIELQNGEIIRCTPNHKFFNGREYISSDKLSVGDNLTDLL